MRIRPCNHQPPRGLESGFGLVEIMIVVCVITILGCMAVPFVTSARESVGEFYTPPEVATIMSRVLQPEPGTERRRNNSAASSITRN